MVKTRSDGKSEMEKLFDEKLASVASKQCIEDLKMLIMEQGEKIKEQNEKINSVNEQVSTQKNTIDILKDRFAVLSSAVEHLKTNADQQEQYSRRTCLRINGIKKDKDETAEKCLNKVQQVCKELNVNIPDDSFDRAHRIGKDKMTMIVKFTSFKHRTLLYRNRKID